MIRAVGGLGLVMVLGLASGACDAAQQVGPPVAASLGAVTSTSTPSTAPSAAAPSSSEAPDVDTPDEDSASASPDTTPSAAPSAPVPSGDAAEGMAGTWTGTWQNDPQWGDANGGFTMQIAQEGSTFHGTIDVSGPTCVRHGTSSGTLTGRHISFGIVAASVRDVDFEGTLTGNQMAGTWRMIACGLTESISGSWAAER